MLSPVSRFVLTAAVLLAPASAFASFHIMQIEQVTGGVYGDATQQAVQLRLREGGQNLVASARVRVFDAAGLNPITLVDMNASVPNGQQGRRILIVSPNFAATQTPTPNFTMSALIPESYFAAGRITFEADGGQVYWSFCWGGAGYTGSTTGVAGTGFTANDADGNFGPCVAGPLPSLAASAWRFTGAASALSTNNAADYVLDAAPVYTNNAGVAGVTPLEMPLFFDGFED